MDRAAIQRAILVRQLAVWALAAAGVALLHHPRGAAVCCAAVLFAASRQKKTNQKRQMWLAPLPPVPQPQTAMSHPISAR